MKDSKGHSNDLPIIQKWMQAVITHEGGVRPGIESSEAKRWIDIPIESVESIVTPSRKRTSVQRLEVYSNAYLARLVECMQSIFPVFVKTVGDELFTQFAMGYLQSYPSKSYTLNRLGDNFVRYLEETRPPQSSDRDDWVEFLISLARVEWEIDQVFDGPGYEGQQVIQAEQLQQLTPDEFWNSQAVLVPCIKLLELPFPVGDYLTAVRREENPGIPAAAPTWLALTRREFVVRRIPLTRFQYGVLLRILDGISIGQAIESSLEAEQDIDPPMEVVAATFQKFATEQLILAIKAD